MNLPTEKQLPTVENIAHQLDRMGFKTEICKDFVVVKYTKQAAKIGNTVVGLQLFFKCLFVTVNQTNDGFYISKSE